MYLQARPHNGITVTKVMLASLVCVLTMIPVASMIVN